MMAVLRAFGGYTISTILAMPFCHFIKLFSLAEKAEALDALAVTNGRAASHDDSVLQDFMQVKYGRMVRDKRGFRAMVEAQKKRNATNK